MVQGCTDLIQARKRSKSSGVRKPRFSNAIFKKLGAGKFQGLVKQAHLVESVAFRSSMRAISNGRQARVRK